MNNITGMIDDRHSRPKKKKYMNLDELSYLTSLSKVNNTNEPRHTIDTFDTTYINISGYQILIFMYFITLVCFVYIGYTLRDIKQCIERKKNN